MSTVVNKGWGGKRNSSGGGDFPDIEKLYLKDNQKYHLRLVLQPLQIFKYWYNKKFASAWTIDNCPIIAEYGSEYSREPDTMNVVESKVIFCFDRSDQNKLKIFEGSPACFEMFREKMELTGKDQGTGHGSDWIFERRKEGNKRKFMSSSDGEVPFTEEERKQIMEICKPEAETPTLAKIYPHTSEEKIRERLFGEASSAPSTPPPAQEQGVGATQDSSDVSKEAPLNEFNL